MKLLNQKEPTKKTIFNQKGFSLIGALITGVISLIIVGTTNDLVIRSIKSSSKAEKITHTLNDKQRIINWFNNDLICAQTLKNYPMTETEKTTGKTLHDSTVQPEITLKIKNPQGDVLETLDSASSSSLERIVIKQIDEDEDAFELLFYEKSLDSKNTLYERKPQEADQIIVACGSTTTAGYVIDRCGSSCLCSAGQEIFNGNCTPKCNEGYVRQEDGTCQCPQGLEEEGNQCQCPEGRVRQEDGTCQCPENQALEKDEYGKYQCACIGRQLVLDKTTKKCRKGKDCSNNNFLNLGPNGHGTGLGDDTTKRDTIPNVTHDSTRFVAASAGPWSNNSKRYYRPKTYKLCKNNDDGSIIYWCTTKKGYDNGFKLGMKWFATESWTIYCYDGQLEILKDPYKSPRGSCTTEGFISLRRYRKKWSANHAGFTARDDRLWSIPIIARKDPISSKALKDGDVMLISEEDPTSTDKDKQCYRDYSN